mgnify:CR=1 FL=1
MLLHRLTIKLTIQRISQLNGKITLTTIGNLNPLSSIATKVTVTVTNADGSTAMSEFTFTVTKG